MEISKKRVSFHTLGCKLNFAETSAIARSLPDDRYDKVPQGADADIYVINTCTVTGTADRKCRQTIKKLISRSPDALIAVVGCYAQLKPEKILAIPGVDIVLGNYEKFNLADYLVNKKKGDGEIIHACGNTVNDSYFPAFSIGGRTRSFLKVQDGCDYRCSYCTIPDARGPSRNQDIVSLVSEAEKIAENGIKEIVLTGVNIGDFGKSTGDTFTGLLKELVKVEGIERYRISSIEPDLISSELIDFAAGSGKILPHFHIPLQSGSDHVLKMMRRRYKRELFERKVSLIKTRIPLAGIGADVIVGFPGESDADFTDTLSFLEKMPLSYLHVFSFSERPGTPAWEMPGKVPYPAREERSKRLISLSDRKHREFCIENTGKNASVLFEHSRKEGMITGFTGNYLSVEYPWNNNLAGKIRKVFLKGMASSGKMTAEIIN